MSRETLKEFLARTGSSADSISFGSISDENGSGNVDRGDDLGIDPNTGKQLIQMSDADKGLLGDYVNYIATYYRGGNKYGIAAGNKESNDNNRGSSIQNAETTSDDEVFAKQSTTLGETLGSYSNSGKFESAESGLDTIIDKTSANKELDGHSLLNATGDEIDRSGSTNPGNEDDDSRQLKKMTTEMLQRNNRFSPGTKGVQYSESRTETNDKIDNKDIAKAQNSFGAYNASGESFIQEKLKSVGASLLLKAAGLDIDTMDPDTFDASSIKNNIKGSVVSRDIEAGNAYNSPVDRDSRGAYDSSSAQTATTVHNVPGLEFQSENTTLNDKILVSFDNLLKNVLIDDADRTRDNNSVYTTNSYYDSVERFLESTIRNKETEDKDKAYFASMARSVLREELESVEQKERIRKFLDVFAVIGDTDLVLFQDIVGKEKKRIWDIDQLTDGPATRISKSRSKNGFSTKSLAWRASSMPSMYHMPMSILRSVQRTGSVSKKNPVKAMMGSSLGEKTYLAQNLELNDAPTALDDFSDGLFGDQEVDTTRNKIPKAMVDIYEDMLDAEYVPFYFHDLRTNEIVAFHAFLSSLTDAFQANHTPYEGYGRMDDVQIYKNTKRTISGKFMLVATSKEDFDEMWFKVNKLVEMLYPQWSRGESVKSGTGNENTQFIRPFSQIPTISPMIRLRIGDVIRGNYSRFNLGRLFGSGHVETYIDATSVLPTTLGSLAAGLNGESDAFNSATDTINEAALQAFMAAFGTPLQFLDLIPGDINDSNALGGEIKRLAFQVLSQVLDNGFVNPLVLDGINKLKNPDVEANLSEFGLGGTFNKEYGPPVGSVVLVKPSQGKYRYITDENLNIGNAQAIKIRLAQESGRPVDEASVLSTDSSVEKVLIDRHLKCRILDKKQIDTTPGTNKTTLRTFYNVVVIEPTVKNLYKKMLTVSHEDVIVDPDWVFKNYFAWFLDPVNNAIELLQNEVNDLAASAGLMGDSIDLFTTTFEDFMSPYNNSITKSFEESAGRGLAGFIGNLSYDLVGDNTNWEIDHGSRAPMRLEISFDFKPIHDIAPGLDADGFSRAPVYNVGSIMNDIAGDQQGEGLGSKNRYNKAANDAVKKENKE